jgi:hypothetical protein
MGSHTHTHTPCVSVWKQIPGSRKQGTPGPLRKLFFHNTVQY